MAAVLPPIVASDLDGTLLRSDGTPSERTRRALVAVREAGSRIVLCTARPVRWVRPLAGELGGASHAVCANGAVSWDLCADTGLDEHAIEPRHAQRVVAAIEVLYPGGAWAVERAAGFGHEPAYRPAWPVPADTEIAPVLTLLAGPAVKLMFRHPDHSPDEMSAGVRTALAGQVEVSHSHPDDGLLELTAPGVDKGSGLARICAALGAGPEDVIAFGDMPNDLPMLRFAGAAVAVADAHPDVLAAADEVTAGHDEDGVAIVLERLLAGRPRRRAARAPDLVFATTTQLPRPDLDSPLLVAALAEHGVRAEMRPWDGERGGGEPGGPRWARAPLVVVRSTWNYFDRVRAFLDWVMDTGAVTTLENPAELIRWNAHKSYLLDLARAGVSVVPTRLLGRDAGAAERAAALVGGELVIKPAVSAGAIGALRVMAEDPRAARHLEAVLATGEALIQPFQAAVVDGEVSLIYFGGEFSHAVRKLPGPGDYRVQDRFGGTVTAHQPEAAELTAAAAALVALPAAPLYARIDLVGGTRPLLMEAELIEPELFLPYAPAAAERYAAAITSRLARL